MLLKISNLSKLYSDGTKALTDVNLEISNGMFGLLGPNGAGKSSLMRTIATLQEPSSGTIHLDELDVINQKDEMRKVLGYLPQDFGFYPKVSAEDMLHHFAILKGISNKKERKEVCDALLNQTNLYEVKHRYIGDYSGGMRQRFGIAQALLGNPKVVIVDEPTAGLDPQERNRFHNLLSEVGENIVVILSTHIVEDVRNLCNNMAVMNLGQVLFKGKTSEALDLLRGKIFSATIAKEELNDYRQQHKVISTKVSEGKIIVHVMHDSLPDNKFTPVEADLEDVYFSYINVPKN
ncbi:MAG: multidrug transporter ATP-binding protein [Bacteroidetes bacterium]|jgi:ABC-type multidrug transport system ATPase subunit|nr:multidrug transporter ATP-binding protein [Bacteroidota bacterium]